MNVLYAIIVSVDQFVNAAFGWLFNRFLWGRFGMRGPFGCPDETISSVLGKLEYLPHVLDRCTVVRALACFLDWIDPGHCKDAVEWGRGWTIRKIELTAEDV